MSITYSYSSPDDWIDSKLTVADLKGKTVEFALRGRDGHTYAGYGRLIAVSNGSLMRVRILFEQQMSKDMSHASASAFIIEGKDSDKLVRNPSGSKCEFSYRNL